MFSLKCAILMFVALDLLPLPKKATPRSAQHPAVRQVELNRPQRPPPPYVGPSNTAGKILVLNYWIDTQTFEYHVIDEVFVLEPG